jgi:2-oxoglutarate dehydrogenase E2 component (dihydrolipoamide succinyltransferase)
MIDIVMPRIGKGVESGTLVKWLKRAGEPVGRDESLFEMSTKHVDCEVPSPVEGILAEVLVREGSTVDIHTVVARLAVEEEHLKKN